MCTDFMAPTFQLLQQHLFRVHSGNFSVTCCSVSFSSASSYRKHIQRKHRDIRNLPVNDIPSDENSAYHQDDDIDHGSVDQPPAQKLNTALWIMKMKETQK